MRFQSVYETLCATCISCMWYDSLPCICHTQIKRAFSLSQSERLLWKRYYNTLYNFVLTFESVIKTLTCDHWSYWARYFHGVLQCSLFCIRRWFQILSLFLTIEIKVLNSSFMWSRQCCSSTFSHQFSWDSGQFMQVLILLASLAGEHFDTVTEFVQS